MIDDKNNYAAIVSASKSSNWRWVGVFIPTLIVAYLMLASSPQYRVLQGDSDFIIYYTAARLINDNQGRRLYDLDLQRQYQQSILNALHSEVQFPDKLLPYNHPPFEIIWFLPLASLSYLKAFLVWNVFSLACFGVGLVVLIKSSGLRSKANVSLVCFLSLAFLPLFATLLQGQDTALVFLYLVLAFVSLKKSREIGGGLWLSLVLQKFQILFPILLLMLVKRRWRVLGGFLIGSIGAAGVSLAIVGLSGLRKYFELLIEMTGWVNRYGMYPSQMHSLRGQFLALWHDRHPNLAIGMTAVSSLFLVGLMIRSWKGKWDVSQPIFDLKFALLVIIALLVSPHLNFHDLSLLLLPGLLIYQFTLREILPPSESRMLLIMLFLVGYPILVATFIFSAIVPIQLSVWALLMLSGILMHQLRRFSSGVA